MLEIKSYSECKPACDDLRTMARHVIQRMCTTPNKEALRRLDTGLNSELYLDISENSFYLDQLDNVAKLVRVEEYFDQTSTDYELRIKQFNKLVKEFEHKMTLQLLHL